MPISTLISRTRELLLRPKGEMRSKNESELESAINLDEALSTRSGGLVVIGLILEIGLAWFFPLTGHPVDPSPFHEAIDRWGAVIADSLVALGVIGEIFFARHVRRGEEELRRRSNDQLGTAEKEAADARKLAAEIQLMVAWRHTSFEQREKIGAAINTDLVNGKSVWIEYEETDPEAFVYAREIASIFAATGMHRFAFNGNHWMVGNEPVFGLVLGNWPEFDPEPFLKAFNDAGVPLITKDGLRRPYKPVQPTDIYIFVGSKTPPDFAAKTAGI